ncbi:FdrA family protein [Nonomuraea gerenzanensis]|uniref:Putative oxidoreductase subunit n=1 Tax=Nonomuraea gerenzanensis TaxID=93944 RepID=A0A1M4EKG3_9ACTN|nr:FdrA family protein [Nonomuraea gerenzanensis]UBU10629.1 FdrA family protein [Nonomuraea gerenzanensis]SBO99043.1 Putative oxidoreductase subunit [Nonomuraea gerenzanensis]
MTGLPQAVLVRRGAYHDSVTLMRVSRALSELPGVAAAMVAMATDLNVSILREMGFPVPESDPGDLLIAVRARDTDAAAGEAERLLTEVDRPRAAPEEQPPLTTRSAAARGPADLVLVSTPGEYAYFEALDAVEAGLPVMIFSDGVTVERERRLKELAEARGVLVMGPDCGTAAIGGAGLGFANVLTPGPVGVVAASGTGAQQVTCLLDWAGAGVSHVLGVGGRDLSAEVGGLSARRALRMLDEDPATELIVLVSKPPAPEVARAVLGQPLRTPVVVALLGTSTGDLTQAAEQALLALGKPVPEWPSWLAPPGTRPAPKRVKGLYSGGTLSTEAALLAGQGDFVDYGDDAYTRGRAHPVIDPTLRVEALARTGERDVVLMDVVLGHGADPDPAASLAPAVAATPATVVIALIGTEGDPQDLHRQAAAFREAGASVFTSNAQAARHARSLV